MPLCTNHDEFRYPQLIGLLLILISVTSLSPAQIPNHGFQAHLLDAENARVSALGFQPDGKIIVAGRFASLNGKSRNGIGRLNADGTIDLSFSATIVPSFPGVTSIIVLGDGKIILAGQFTAPVNGSQSKGVVRLNSDGSADPQFTVGPNNSNVMVAAVQPDGKLIVGGRFGTFNGVSRPNIARLNLDGSVDTSFTAAPDGDVLSLMVQSDGKIIAGGQFSTVNGVFRQKIVRFNSDGTTDPSFTFSSGSNVTAFKLQTDGKLLVGRSGLVTGENLPSVVRLNPDSTLDTSFTCNISEYSGRYVRSLEVQPDGKILAAGQFDGDPGISNGIYRLNTNGLIDTSFAQTVREYSLFGALLQPNGQIVIGGVIADLTSRSLLRRLDQSGNTDLSFPGFVGNFSETYAVSFAPGGKIYVGGAFTQVNGEDKRYFVRLNRNGTIDRSFNAGLTNGPVYDIAVQPDGKVIVGGDFGLLAGTSRWHIGRINPDGTIDQTFDSDLGADGTVNDIALQADGKLIIGGVFTHYADIPRHFVARVNSDGSLDQTFNTSPSDPANAITSSVPLSNGQCVIAGYFGYLGSNRASKIARLNGDGSFDPTFNEGGFGAGPDNIGSPISSVALQPDGKIVAGGAFTSFNGVTKQGLLRLNPDGTLDSSFVTSASKVFDVRSYSDGRLLIGGGFTTIGGASRGNFARLFSDGTLDPSFGNGPGADDWVYATDYNGDGEIVVAGKFKTFDGQTHVGIAKLGMAVAAAVAPFDFDGDSKTDLSIFRPLLGEWWINRSGTGVTWATQFGASTDKIVPGDFTGDGKADVAFWRPESGEWFVLRSENFSYFSFPFGTHGDVPVAADYDADGKGDAAVFRPSNSTWYVRRSSDGGFTIQQFGAPGDVPVPSDYDGDGKADIAIFRPSVGQWWMNRSTAGVLAVTFGSSTDKLVPGDYTGDGKSDNALFRPSTGQWFVLRSDDFSFYSFPFGTSTDIAAPGDYDGDGKFDATVFRPPNATWYSQRSTAGTLIQQFGVNSDVPVASAYVR